MDKRNKAKQSKAKQTTAKARNRLSPSFILQVGVHGIDLLFVALEQLRATRLEGGRQAVVFDREALQGGGGKEDEHKYQINDEPIIFVLCTKGDFF